MTDNRPQIHSKMSACSAGLPQTGESPSTPLTRIWLVPGRLEVPLRKCPLPAQDPDRNQEALMAPSQPAPQAIKSLWSSLKG